MNSDCFVFVEERDEFRMWQGLVGPYYTPAVDSLGNLSWTNNGNLVNPPTVNVSGRGLTITGIVDASTDLPETAPQYTCYLVGTTSPYHAYIFDGTSWIDLGVVGKGDTGFSPVVTVTPITGGHQVSIEDAVDTQTFNVMDGVGVPAGGTTGQVLAKASGTDYNTAWVTRANIVNPNLLDNWYFVGGGSQQGGQLFPINQRGLTSYDFSSVESVFGISRWRQSQSVLAINSDNIAVNRTGSSSTWSLFQVLKIPDLTGKTITFSALVKEFTGTVKIQISYSQPGQSPVYLASQDITSNGLTSLACTLPNVSIDLINAIFWMKDTSSSVKLQAVKLELGDTQTLTHQENGAWVLNELPDYEEQLIRCKTNTAVTSDPYANGSVEFGSNIGIVQNTDKATQSISEGQYVIWHGALYTASAAIASGATLSSSNLTAVTDGGLNSVDLRMLKRLYSNDDLDNIHGTGATGLYYIGANVPNSPINYATMLVISREGSSGYATQLVLGNGAYLREYSGSPASWRSWKRLDNV